MDAMTAPDRPDPLDRSTAILEDLFRYWAGRAAAAGTEQDRAEALRAQLGIARGFAELAAVQRGVPLYAHPDPGRDTP